MGLMKPISYTHAVCFASRAYVRFGAIVGDWLVSDVDGTQLLCILWYIIIILGISFMQGIYSYIPETNHVPREHCVAAILM